MLLKSLAAATLVALVAADVYMHNPRGSNDRNCERNVNRNNGNRLFDSQNNAKGGYACPRPVGGPEVQAYVPNADLGEDFFDQTQLATQTAGSNTSYYQKMYYLAGSKLPIEWTSQHGCGGNQKEHCDIVIQYACEDTLDPFFQYDAPLGTADRWIGSPRDGLPTDAGDAATNTIPDDPDAAVANTQANRRFGMHENQRYYEACRQRSRNRGLFTADQNLRRRDARATRQNPNGNRNGLECPEERDHYPYWHANPWIDIAILHDHATGPGTALNEWCEYYVANSQNNPASTTSGVCMPVDTATETPAQVAQRKAQGRWHNNEAECTAAGHSWENHRFGINPNTAEGAAKLAALDAVLKDVDCQLAPASRINHLGNAVDSNYDTASDAVNLPHDNNAARYVWTIPAHYNENCVLRLRYNISTSDYPAFSDIESDPKGTPGLNATFNGEDNSPITQDPYIYLDTSPTKFVSLAVNTNQYGRTFQDRSYVFAIRKPSTTVANQMATRKLFNLNVRGKRGNIVQTYPAVEYDFVPNNLQLSNGDMVHFQWTGSDYNPRRGCNNGEGGPPDGDPNQNSRADRSNLISMEVFADQYPSPALYPQGADAENNAADRPTFGSAGTMFSSSAEALRMAFIKQEEPGRFLSPAAPCLTQGELEAINNKNARENHPQNCAKMNRAETPYFDGGVSRMTKNAVFAYFSSRNNNFSNRDQTGRVCVAANAAQCDSDLVATATKRVPVPNSINGATVPVLAQETFAFNEKDNDSTGDGEKEDCEEFGSFLASLDDGTAAGLIIGMLIVGCILTLCCQWGIRWYLVKPKSPQDICCGGDMNKGNRKPVSKRASTRSTPPPPPARKSADSWQRGNVGSALPAPLGNSLTPPEPPARRAPHERVPPGPPARKTAASSAVASRQVPPPPPSRQANSAPMGSGPRVIPPPPPRR